MIHDPSDFLYKSFESAGNLLAFGPRFANIHVLKRVKMEMEKMQRVYRFNIWLYLCGIVPTSDHCYLYIFIFSISGKYEKYTSFPLNSGRRQFVPEREYLHHDTVARLAWNKTGILKFYIMN